MPVNYWVLGSASWESWLFGPGRENAGMCVWWPNFSPIRRRRAFSESTICKQLFSRGNPPEIRWCLLSGAV